MRVRNKKTGRIYSMYRHHYEAQMNEFELVELIDEKEVSEVVEDIKEDIKDLSYAEMKEVAKRLGIEFKGNISKKGLAKLLK